MEMLKSCSNVKVANIPVETFELYFKSVNNPMITFPDEDVLYFIIEKDEFNIMFEELNMPFNYENTFYAIKQLSNNKSGGPDKYIYEMFIYGKEALIPHVSELLKVALCTIQDK